MFVLAFAWVEHSGYRGLNGADSHDYYRVARAWYLWVHGGERPPAAEHPPGFPLMGALYGTVLLGHVLAALRSMVFLSFLGLGWVMLRLVRRQGLSGQAGDALVLLGIGASPFLLRHALVVMSDIPALALVIGGYACVVFGRERRSAWWFSGAALAWGLAIAMRFAAVPVIGAALVFLLVDRLPPVARARATWMVLAIAMISAAWCTFRPAWLAAHLSATPLEDWSALNLVRTELHSDDGVLRYRFPNLLYVLGIAVHPGFLPIGALILPFFRRADLKGFLPGSAGAMLAAYLLFTAGLPFQNDRVMLMAQPFIVLLLAPAFGRAWAWCAARQLRPTLITAAFTLAQAGLFVRAMAPFIRSARVERELATVVRGLDPHHVYTHGMGPALSNLCPGVAVTELWYAPIERFDPGALLVVHPENLAGQWGGLHPAGNWQRALQQGVVEVYRHPDGWVITRIE